jgi:formylglycine-generating enzyme required for sulfatase activity
MAKRQQQLYESLSVAAKKMARIPRLCRLLAMLPPERLRSLNTDADVLWEVYTYDAGDAKRDNGLIIEGLKADLARPLGWRGAEMKNPPVDPTLQRRLARQLLGAVAFEMISQVNAEGKPRPAWNGIDLDPLIEKARGPKQKKKRKTFKDWVLERLLAAGVYSERDQHWFGNRDWNALLAMDSHGLSHFIFRTDAKDRWVRFDDRTTLAFFAAYWACCWATADQRRETRRWIIDPRTGDNQSDFDEFWSFAVEMPDPALESDNRTELFAPLYYVSLQESEVPIRSTELIYRTWHRMSDTDAQKRFLGEFEVIKTGGDGPENQRVARSMLADESLIPLVDSGKPLDTGTFTMGAPDGEDPVGDGRGDAQRNPQHPVTLTPFLLHRFCVTNVEYELFNPRHRDYRWVELPHHSWEEPNKHALAEKAAGGDDRCPAVNVSWFDAFCFVKWVGTITRDGRQYCIALPSEAQWEYACRCGKHGKDYAPFTFNEDHPGHECKSGDCNFDGQCPWRRRHDENGSEPQYTVPVDDQGQERRWRANPWGFFHMHGNVWEWCDDWYAANFYDRTKNVVDPRNLTQASERVARGGCFFRGADDCRSASRHKSVPHGRGQGCGFRLAAVPCDVGAKQGQQA